MAENVGSIEYVARINTDDFKKDAKDLENSAEKAAGGLDKKMTDASKSVAVGLGIAGAAAVAFGALSVKAFNESEAVMAQTNAVLKSTGGIAGVTADQVSKMASAFQKTTKYTDEEVQSAENLLLSFTKIGKDIFPDATKTVLNMSTALGQDLKSSSVQLGKALQDPVQGITALRRVGVNFSDAQKDVIQKLVDTGKSAEAQKLILKELETEFGGSAEAAGKTFGGQLTILKNQFGDFQELVGKAIVDKLAPLTKTFLDWVDSMGGVQGIFDKIGKTVADHTPEIQALGIVIATLVAPAFYSWAAGAAIAAANTLIALAPVIAIGVALGALWVAYQRLTPVRKIIDGIVDVFQKLWEVLKPIAAFVGGIFVDIWHSLVDIFKQLVEALKPVFDALREFYQKHSKGVQQAFKIIAAVVGIITFGPLIVAVGLLIAGLKLLSIVLKFVADHFKGIANILKGVFLVAISPIIATVFIVIETFKLLRAAVGFLIDVFQVAATVITTVFTTIYNVITTVINAIWTVLGPILGFIKNLFIIVFGSILIVVVEAFKAIYNAIVPVVQAIWTFLQPIVNAILNFFVTRWQNLVANTQMVFNALLNFFTTIWNAIYGVFRNVVNSIINFFAPAVNWLYNAGRNVFQGLMNGLNSIAGAIWGAVKNGADKIGQFFSGAGGWLYDAGRAIFQGLINGISSIGQGVYNKAKEVMDRVRKLFPFSPAKEGPFSGKGWTAYSGQALMEGLTKGINKAADMPFNAINSALERVAPVISPTITPSVAAVSSVGAGQSAAVITNNIGDITLASDVDADRFIEKLTYQDDVISRGLTPQRY